MQRFLLWKKNLLVTVYKMINHNRVSFYGVRFDQIYTHHGDGRWSRLQTFPMVFRGPIFRSLCFAKTSAPIRV